MGICAGVWACVYTVCVFIPIHICWLLCHCKHVCGFVRFGWLILLCHSQLFASTHFFICFCVCVFMFVCMCVCILFGDLEVWSTQNMNKWKALAVGTEVFARSKDPSSLWTHPAVPLSLPLSEETKTLANQATLNHNTSARTPRDGHG